MKKLYLPYIKYFFFLSLKKKFHQGFLKIFFQTPNNISPCKFK